MQRAWSWLAVAGISLASLGCDGESDGGGGAASGGGGSAGAGGASSGGTSGSGGSATGGTAGSGGSAAGGASGSAGAAGGGGSAGSGGASGAGGKPGTGGLGGTGGTGGTGSKTCAQLEADYAKALAKAKSCSGILPVVQCAESVQDELACPCPTFVEATNTAAIAELKALEKQWKDDGCNVIVCPAIACVSPGSAACSSAGVCQDLKSSPN